jgi:hypothetical protein
LIDLGRRDANPTRQLARVPDLNPSSLTRRKLRDMRARDFSLEFNFSVDCDHEERRLLQWKESASHGRGACNDNAGRWRL